MSMQMSLGVRISSGSPQELTETGNYSILQSLQDPTVTALVQPQEVPGFH